MKDPAARISKSPEAAASFFAENGEIIVNQDDPLNINGWEEWDLSQDLKVTFSRGWYDADDYARQVERV